MFLLLLKQKKLRNGSARIGVRRDTYCLFPATCLLLVCIENVEILLRPFLPISTTNSYLARVSRFRQVDST